MKKTKKAFTLIEIIVSIMILWIIMISIMTIFTLASEVSMRSDLNRNVQENIKNVVETIAEDIRKNGISGVSQNMTDYSVVNWTWSALETWIWSSSFRYYLSDFYDNSWDRKDISFCMEAKNTCTIYKKDFWPLANSTISFTHLEFFVTNWPIKKVTINFRARPANKNWVRMSLLKDNIMNFQTTISERNLQVK